MKNKQENKAKSPEKWQFFREMSLRYQSACASWELYTMHVSSFNGSHLIFEKIIILLCNNTFCFRQENRSNSV
jgi:hypothetical protein